MAIVTISRGSGSGGQELAGQVAKELGYGIVSREEVVREATRFGASETALREALLKPPGLWDRFQHERRRYLAFVQAALCERVQQDDVVYHGNAGHLLLPGVSHVLRVRLIAPVEFRDRVLREREDISDDEAVEQITKLDREREKWTRFLYGVDWLDAELYDLCINLRTLDVADAVRLVEFAARSPRFESTAESRQALADLVLQSRVGAALAADPRTASAEVQLRVEDGVVYLRGRLRPASLVDAVLDVAAGVAGVERVDREDLAAPDYTV
jgi:cytidylate kinase